MRHYKFSSVTEFNAVLRQYNVMADRGKEGMIMFNKNGLLYSTLDDKGNRIGVPIKASALNSKPTLKNLQTHFQRGAALKLDAKERLTDIIDSFFHYTSLQTRTNFCDYMTSRGINAMFRENKEGRVYGLTFVDNRNGAVFNGSDLGKPYSGQPMIKQLEAEPNITAAEKGKAVITSQSGEKPDLQSRDFPSQFASNYTNYITGELFGLMEPINSGEEPINPKLEKIKKKKRGISR